MPAKPNICEYRVVLPMKVEEYQVAQLWSVAEASKNETGGGEGIEVQVNEPFDATSGKQPSPALKAGGKEYTTGQYTYKIYHLESKVPRFLRYLAPKGSLQIHEEAWNAYPYCRTIITNPGYMKEHFYIKIETFHAPDRGQEENIHDLNPEVLKQREVVHIDIANDPISASDYKEEWDPKKYKSEKTQRGPLEGQWQNQVEPVMCAYKLVSVHFKWFGLQNRVEKYIHKTERRIFFNFHRQVFCWTDKWYGLNMDDIRQLEDKTKEELDHQRQQGAVRGMKGEEDDEEKNKKK